jgi:D-alanine-D-alanine ligase
VPPLPELPERVNLVVLFGGQSAEHDVSRATAVHVMNALDRSRYNVRAIGITRDGQWVQADAAAHAALERLHRHQIGSGPAIAVGVDVVGDTTQAERALMPSVADPDAPTVVLPLLHGPMGEDGTVQGLLELADVAYVGGGVLGSAVAMDKAMAKTVLGAHGIAQAEWRAVHEHEVNDDTVSELIAALGLPMFVKPANMGSSIGVVKAKTVDEVADAIRSALEYDSLVVCEEAIVGREIEVAVLGNSHPRASLPGEVVPGKEFYDFADKYLEDSASYFIPAKLSPAETHEIQALALRSFAALRCSGLARVDFFYEEGGRGFLCNEANTMPGFTPISMYPKLWAASGLAYPDLIDELIRLALQRHAQRRRNTASS